MPDLKRLRLGPGSFMTEDKSKMYVFGGRENSVEIIDFKAKTPKFKVLPVILPQEICDEDAFCMVPGWQIPIFDGFLDKTHTLIFGGYQRQVFKFDTKTNKVATFSKNLILQIADWFYGEPDFVKNELLLLGVDHVHVIDLEKEKAIGIKCEI